MKFDINNLKWIREPRQHVIQDGKIEITTEPGTDLWQRTYYHFRNDNAPVLQMETEEKFFSLVVKTDFTGAHHRFDQCGVVMYLDSENWLKGSVEYENEEFQHLGSVVNGIFERILYTMPPEPERREPLQGREVFRQERQTQERQAPEREPREQAVSRPQEDRQRQARGIPAVSRTGPSKEILNLITGG